MPDCQVCSIDPERVVARPPHAQLILPPNPHIAPKDGGHLYVAPVVHADNRRALCPAEMLAVDWGSMLAAEALRIVFGADWFNFQENGNWALDSAGSPHMHLHVYGRRRDSDAQPFGEALRFPLQDERDDWHPAEPSAEDQGALKRVVGELLESKFVGMRAAVRHLTVMHES